MKIIEQFYSLLINLSLEQYIMLFGIFSLSYVALRYFYKTWQLIIIPKLEENMVETTIYISPYVKVKTLVEPVKKRRKLKPGQFVFNITTNNTYFSTATEAEAYNKKIIDHLRPVNCSLCNATAMAYSRTDKMIFCYPHALNYSQDISYAEL